MAKEEKFDVDKEIEKISRNSRINMRKAENSYESRLKKLDREIEKASNKKIREFNENKDLLSEYVTIDYTDDTINRYREKLKKI